MSRPEQVALLAFFNSFKLSKAITAFDQLSDGKLLMELMSAIDATHFRNTAARGLGSSTSGTTSSENWVLKMNALKRLYRLLLSYPLPSPHPPTRALTSLREPAFATIAKSPSTSEGTAGLLQISRLCLAVGVWAPGNEKVIGKIQGLSEDDMAELMRSIEEVMATLPQEKQKEGRSSPLKPSPELSPPVSNIRTERDDLLQETDELRARCDLMDKQVEEMRMALAKAKTERDEALAGVASRSRGDISAGSNLGLRRSQTASSDMQTLRAELHAAEEDLEQTEADLDKQTSVVADLLKMVEDLKSKAAEAGRLKDQLDEFRYTAERLRKSENVIEKYRKKLEDSAGLRKELRSLEEENAALVDTKSSLEADLKRSDASKPSIDSYKHHIDALEKYSAQQAAEIAELHLHLDVTRNQLSDTEAVSQRDRAELQLHQERVRELEQGATAGLKARQSSMDLLKKTTLGEELDKDGADEGEPIEPKTELRQQIRALQSEVAEARSASSNQHEVAALESMLAEANKSRQQMEAEFLEAHRSQMRLQAILDMIRSGRNGNNAQGAEALRHKLNEVLEEQAAVLKEKQALEAARLDLDKQLRAARTDLSLVGKDQLDMMASLRESAMEDSVRLEAEVAELKDQIAKLKAKDRMHLEETKRVLLQKVDLQADGIDVRDRALERERRYRDLRASIATAGTPAEVQKQMSELHERNVQLEVQVQTLEQKLQRAKAFIRNQDELFKANQAEGNAGSFEEAQRSYESQITSLREEIQRAKFNTSALERRYKLEQQLMLSAWHEMGSRTVRDHINAAGIKRSAAKPMPTSWLGRQRKHQEDASFVRESM